MFRVLIKLETCKNKIQVQLARVLDVYYSLQISTIRHQFRESIPSLYAKLGDSQSFNITRLVV